MINNRRVLVLHSDNKKALEIKALLKRFSFRVENLSSSMEGIAYLDTVQPATVILELGIDGVPPVMLVRAVKDMSSHSHIWLCADQMSDRLENEVRESGAAGSLVLPIIQQDLARLTNPVRKQYLDDFDDEKTVSDLQGDFFWKDSQPIQEPLQMEAREINQEPYFHHQGHLTVRGDLKAVKYLEVLGELVVKGSIYESNIRCNGPLRVTGRIQDCRERGVFCRTIIEVNQVINSVVVCGKSLFFESLCQGSLVNAVHHVVGRSAISRLVGGEIRVGEHLDVGILGDEDQTNTTIDMAPELFRNLWIRSKRKLWNLSTSLNRQLKSNRGILFEKQLRDPGFYPKQADIVTKKLNPGIFVTIGPYEDYVFEPTKGPTRIALGPKNDDRLAVRIRPLS